MEHNKNSDLPGKKPLHSADDGAAFYLKKLIPAVEHQLLPVGTTIGKYRIIEEIDRGGMSVVYKALQLDLNREIALKILPANITINQRFVDRFLSEAYAVAKLNHPNIVAIHEVAIENNLYYIAMDYIPGMNLYYYLNLQKPKLVDVLQITATIADALAYAHRQKIIHRDLKLNNIIMRDNLVPIVIDFGLAKAIEDEQVNLTKTGEIMGSPAYMAPERLSGTGSDARSDICSLGIMLYEMLTFKNPYFDPRSTPQTTMNVLKANPLPPRKLVPWLPREIEAITLKAMHKDPEWRYQTMEDFRDDIVRYQNGEPIHAKMPTLLSKTRHILRIYWSLLIIGLMIALFSGILFFTQYSESKKSLPYWHLTFSETFNTVSTLTNNWQQPLNSNNSLKQTWNIQRGALYSPADCYSYIILKQLLTRDIRVEFDIQAVDHDFANAGFFLAGSSPDSGYCFHINKGPDAHFGISFPGSQVLFSEYNPATFPTGTRYHIVVEKKENVLTYMVNGIIIEKLYDNFPALGINHQSIGFFCNGSSIKINNFIVYSYALTRYPDVVVAADRFLLRGEFQTALNEYIELLPSIDDSLEKDIAEQKICECYIRLNSYDAALKQLTAIKADDRRLYLQGLINAKTGNPRAADSSFLLLFNKTPESALCHSAADQFELKIDSFIYRHSIDSASLLTTILINKSPYSDPRYCLLKVRCIEQYIESGDLNKAQAVGESTKINCASNSQLLIKVQLLLSDIYLARYDITMATDLLNQCVASREPSLAVWDAWIQLARLYKYSGDLANMTTIYKKIIKDCPPSLPYPWIARLSMGELQYNSKTSRGDSLLNEVITLPHPYTLLRDIAFFYTNKMSRDTFFKQWLLFNPNSSEYLIYYAKKAAIDHQIYLQRKYLRDYQQTLSPNTWKAIQVNKALSLL